MPSPSGARDKVELPDEFVERRRAKRFAIFALWSPFVAFALTSGLLESLGDEDSPRFGTRAIVVAAGGLLATCGLIAGWLALRAVRSVGRKGLFGRGLFGVIANAVLACLAIVVVTALIWLGNEWERLNRQRQSPGRMTFEAATKRLTRAQTMLDGVATNQQGDVALVAATSSEFLRRLRVVGDDYDVQAKRMNAQLGEGLSETTSKEILQSKVAIAREFLEANDRFAAFSLNRNEIYHQALIEAGVSTNGITTATNAFSSTRVTQKPWEANRRLVQAHLGYLQFLQTNWGRWSYTKAEIEFQAESLRRDYTNLQARVTEAYHELVKHQRMTDALRP